MCNIYYMIEARLIDSPLSTSPSPSQAEINAQRFTQEFAEKLELMTWCGHSFSEAADKAYKLTDRSGVSLKDEALAMFSVAAQCPGLASKLLDWYVGSMPVIVSAPASQPDGWTIPVHKFPHR